MPFLTEAQGVEVADPSSSAPPEVFKRVTEEKPAEHPNNAVRQIMKELKEFNQNTFAEEQIQLRFKDEEDPFSLIITLTPNDGLYKDGHFEVLMKLSEEYPKKKPALSAIGQIFHPNISYDGNICFSLLNETSSHLRITDYAHGMLWLLYYPNLFSVMNSDCSRDGTQFVKFVRTSIEGGTVAGKNYPRSKVLVERDEAKAKKAEEPEPEPEPESEPEEKEKEKGDTNEEEGKKEKKAEEPEKEKKGKGKEKEKKWEWHLIGQEWLQFFEDELDRIPAMKEEAERKRREEEERWYNACFAGRCQVQMANGTHKRVDEIRRGDRVCGGSFAPSAEIVCVVRTHIANQTPSLVELPESGLLVTETHPVRIDGEWRFPRDVVGEGSSSRPTPDVPYIYSFVMESGHAMVINGVECIGLGHGIEGDEVASHPYFGTGRVVEDLKGLRGWSGGVVTLEEGAFRRSEVTGMLDGLNPEREI